MLTPPPTDIIQIFENIVSPSTLILPPKIIENIVIVFGNIDTINLIRDASITPP